MLPSPQLAADWEHRGGIALLVGALCLAAAVGSFYWPRRFLRGGAAYGSIEAGERLLPLRGRWLRLGVSPLLITLLTFLLVMALGSCMHGFACLREAARYYPHR